MRVDGLPDAREVSRGPLSAAGVLFVNLGTPEAPTTSALRRWLRQFLSDPRVVWTNRVLWWLLLNGVILWIRPARSARAYRTIWTAEGSPLLVNSRRVVQAVAAALRGSATGPVHVALGMNYGLPSIPQALEELRRTGVQRLLVAPLYPQYSSSTNAAVFDALAAAWRRWPALPELRMVAGYCDDAGYIAALTASLAGHWRAHGRADHLLISFHGLPQRYVDAGDPYDRQCRDTAACIARDLHLDAAEWSLVYQSRFGREPWLRPYADQELRRLPARGVRSVDVICPGFAVDCLETLEETAIRNRELFLAAGGREYRYVPALNDRPEQVRALTGLVLRHAAGWPEFMAPTPRHATQPRAGGPALRGHSRGGDP